MEERLKKFTVLVDTGTYTAAAHVLHTSQPALTTAIQKLTKEMKSDLLVHGSRALQLTPTGEIAYEQGQLLLLAEKNLQARIQDLAEQKQPLSIGSIDSIGDAIVRADLLGILELDSELSLTIQNSGELMGALQKGKLDLVIVADQSQNQIKVNLDERFLGNERFVLVRGDARAEEYEPIGKLEILPDFLAYNVDSTTYRLLETQLQLNGLGLKPRLYSTNPSVLLQLVLQGKGIAALPLSLVEAHIGKGVSEIELKKPLYRPIVALWQKGHKLPASVEDFLDAAQIQLV